MDQAICPKCKQTSKPDLEHGVVAGSDLAKHRLSELGIPPYDMVRVESSKGEAVFLLNADRDSAMHV
jgi:adenylyltransferase/sulfurtransferase